MEEDGNTDSCCLCNQGGSLLCCDGCPASYHLRCIGEQAKSLPEGEWLCPECALGGRGARSSNDHIKTARQIQKMQACSQPICQDYGAESASPLVNHPLLSLRNAAAGESAGLRVPRAGLDQAKRPCWLALGALFCSARPARIGSGADAAEAVDGVPVAVIRLIGADALERASFLRRIKREEKYARSSLDALSKPPPSGALPRASHLAHPSSDSGFSTADFLAVVLLIDWSQSEPANALLWVALETRCPDQTCHAGAAEKRFTTGAEGYLNRYRNGWSASSAAIKAYVDETVRRRGKPVGGKPAVPLAELPVPVPISRFLWPFVRPSSFTSPYVSLLVLLVLWPGAPVSSVSGSCISCGDKGAVRMHCIRMSDSS